jgi:hypothetical protein
VQVAAARAFRRAALGCVLCVAGCGGQPDPAQEYALGVPMRAATCADWKRAGPAARGNALDELRALRHDQISGRGAGRGYGSVLNDDLAYRLFENRCKLPNAESYLLYRLYSFAAGFAGESR